ncbi:MAG: DNA helicase [Actinobacteria bacterium]|nr:DNA helicase [Actinomycetota bacterium]
MAAKYRSLDFTETFLETFASMNFSKNERSAVLKALRLIDENEQHPSLRVHKLAGDREGSWSASASRSIRLTFERLDGGRRRMLTCSKHYDR